MSVEVFCPACGKHYSAPPHLVGKRIRCRQCGDVFEAGAAPAAAAPAPIVSEPDTAWAAPDTAHGHHETVAGGVVPAAPVVAASSWPAGLPVPESVEPSPAARRHQIFNYPFNEEVDLWLPRALVFIGVAWCAMQTLGAERAGPRWVMPVRIAVMAALYVLVVVPLVTRAVRAAARRLRFALPANPAWRAAATFVLPVTLGYVLWLNSGGGVGSFAAGCVFGLFWAAGVFWLLFRLSPYEAGVAFAVAGASFVGGLIASVVLLVGMNYALNVLMLSARPPVALRQSPFGEGFSWDIPDGPMVRGPNAQAEPDGSHPADVTNGGSAPARQDVQPPQGPSPGATTSAAATEMDPDRAAATGATLPAPAAPGLAQADPWLAEVRGLPFVRQARVISELGPVRQIILPAAVGPYVAVVRGGEGGADKGAKIECCRITPFRSMGTIPYSRPLLEVPDSGPEAPYVLSADGDTLARLVSFPKLGIEVWPLGGEVPRRAIPVPDPTQTPEIVGGMGHDRFLLRSVKGDLVSRLDVVDGKTGRWARLPQVVPYLNTPGNGEFSPDRTFYAVVVKDQGRSFLQVHDLTRPEDARFYSIHGLDDKRPVATLGLAFSPDGQKVVALLEQGAATMAVVASLREQGPDPAAPLQLTPDVTGPPVDLTAGSRAIDWVGNDAWLVNGSHVVDAATGRLAGTLHKGPAIAHMVDSHTCYLFHPDKDRPKRLVLVEFDPSRLHAAAGAKDLFTE